MQYLDGISGMSLSKMIYPCCLIDSTKLGSILGLGNKNYSIYCKKAVIVLYVRTAFTLQLCSFEYFSLMVKKSMHTFLELTQSN